MKYCAVLMMAVLILAGCSSKPKQLSDVNKMMEEVGRLMEAGQTNAAVSKLTCAVNDKSYKAFRGMIYGNLLSIIINVKGGATANEQYLSNLGKDEELVRTGFSILMNYNRGQGVETFQGWINTMLNQPALPKDLVEQLFASQIEIYQANNQIDQIVALVPSCRQRLDAGAAQRFLQGAASREIDQKRYSNAHVLLNALEKEFGSDSNVRFFAFSERTKVLMFETKWDEAKKNFKDNAGGFKDEQLNSCLNQAVSYCNQNEKYDAVNELCDFIVDNQKDKAKTRSFAAQQLISLDKTRKNVANLPVRLESLRTRDVPVDIMANLTQFCFYTVLQDGTKEQLASMVSFSDKLSGEVKDPNHRSMLTTFVLDGYFILEDYDRVLKILDAGIEGKDSNWHSMVKDKARAHQALKNGNKKEAVEYFRKFMVSIDKWYKAEGDPCSDLLYSKEMCLGFNAKRVGDLLGDIGEVKSSEEAYEEARNYYKKALSELRADSKEAQLVKKEMAAVPEKKNP